MRPQERAECRALTARSAVRTLTARRMPDSVRSAPALLRARVATE